MNEINEQIEIEGHRFPTNNHYNQSSDFFMNMLDPYMKYTTGIFDSSDSSFQASSIRALDYCIELAQLSNGKKVLEIGPGWGSLLKRISFHNIGLDYTGINPSEAQNRFIKDSHRKVNLITGAFETNVETLQHQYDAIFLLGSFCHLTDKNKCLKNLARILAPGGVIVMEDSWFFTQNLYLKHRDLKSTRFVQIVAAKMKGLYMTPSLKTFQRIAEIKEIPQHARNWFYQRN